jgi:hypothetical protein
MLLSAATAGCTIVGVVYAIRRRFDRHRRWMLRSYVLICSTVVLRLILGTAGLIGVSSPEQASIWASWVSWLVPLAALLIVERHKGNLAIGVKDRDRLVIGREEYET